MLSRYLSIIGKTNYILFIVAICMLPFPTQLSLYTWGLWLASWLLEGRFLCKNNTHWHKGLIPIILLVIWFVWETISYTWAINKIDAGNMLVRHLSFVAILPIAIWGVNSNYNWNKIAKYFIISSIVSIIAYGIKIYILDFLSYYQEGQQFPDFLRSWTFFGDRISIYKHRLYYGNVLNLAIVALFQIRIQQLATYRHKKTATTIFFVGLIILVLGIVWTGSRANMLTLLVVSAIAAIQPLRGHTRILVTSMVCVIGIVVGALLFTLHPRFEQLDIDHVTERATYQTNEIEPRINIWYSALQHPQDYLWHGVGVGGNSEYLTSVYSVMNWNAFTERQYNAHNQYIGTLINLGIFGAIFFLLIWLLFPLWYKGRVRQFATLVALTIGLNMLTENMLDRIDGVIITCVTLVTIALLSRDQLAK